MARPWFWRATRLGALAALGLTPPAAAAVVEQREVSVRVEAGGATQEVRQRIRIEDADDVERWSLYAVFVDDNRRLERLEAAVVGPDGSRRPAKRKHRGRADVAQEGILYDSGAFETVTFPALSAGSVLEIEETVRIEPYFPAVQVALLGDDTVERLVVQAHGEGLRWRLLGAADGIAVEETANGLRVTGTGLGPAEPAELAPSYPGSGVWLRLAWGPYPEWRDVGRWYRALLGDAPRDGEVTARARQLVDGIEEPRRRLEALVAFLREDVRYVAVEMGEGSYRPSPAAETLARRWGDCKDKSLLLIEMLQAVGIPAHPVLVRLDPRGDVDLELATPLDFNHLIVAVPEVVLAVADGDPVSGGFFFVDPTQTRGGAAWLHPGVQDQSVVVVAEEGTLVRTPILQTESRGIEVEVSLDANGRAEGTARLLLRGSIASHLAARLEREAGGTIAADLRGAIAGWLPGAAVEDTTWRLLEDEVPSAVAQARVRFDGLLSSAGDRPALGLPGASLFPETRLLGETREDAVVVEPGTLEQRWTLTLPAAFAGCRPASEPVALDGPVGRFTQTFEVDAAGTLRIHRSAQLGARRIELAEVPALRELAIAERRTLKRRLRLCCDCGVPEPDSPAGSLDR